MSRTRNHQNTLICTQPTVCKFMIIRMNDYFYESSFKQQRHHHKYSFRKIEHLITVVSRLFLMTPLFLKTLDPILYTCKTLRTF